MKHVGEVILANLCEILERWILLSKRKRLVDLLIVITIVLSMGILLAVNLPNLLTNREFVGMSTIESYVPIYILYDPPGGGSYSEITTSGDAQVTASFEGLTENRVVKGVYDVELGFSMVGGPENSRMHIAVCELLNLTWGLWHCYLGASEWYEAVLNSTSRLGIGAFRFDNLTNHSMWVEDLTGIPGSFTYRVNVSGSQTESLVLLYSRSQFMDIRAGFSMTLFGIDFTVHVFVNTGGREIMFTQTYSDMDENLSFLLESDGALREISPGTIQMDNMLVWFSL
jgi:hypothetical protein